MNASDYKNILRHLETAASVLNGHDGEMRDVEIRIRHLLSITMTETKRGLREVEHSVAAPADVAVGNTAE